MVHSFFTFYLNLVRKAFNISSVIRRCGSKASAIQSFCWTKALLKGRLLVALGGPRSLFVDFDSFILLWRIPEDKLFDSLWREHVSSPWRGIGPSFLGNIFLRPVAEIGKGAGEGFFNMLTGDIDWWPKDKGFPFPKFGHRTFEDCSKRGASWETFGGIFGFLELLLLQNMDRPLTTWLNNSRTRSAATGFWWLQSFVPLLPRRCCIANGSGAAV